MALSFPRSSTMLLYRKCIQSIRPEIPQQSLASSNLLPLISRSASNTYMKRQLYSFPSCLSLSLPRYPSKTNGRFPIGRKYYSRSSKLKREELTLSTPILMNYLECQKRRCEEAQKVLIESQSVEESNRASQTLYQVKPIVKVYLEYLRKSEEMAELQQMISGPDEEMAEMARQECDPVKAALNDLEAEVLERLIPVERGDNNDVLLEVTAGVGGQEAMLFTEQIFTMYSSFSSYMGWHMDITQYDPNALGGIRYGSAIIRGEGVYQFMKFEGGVHRVQRVPKTEKAGRIHTSTTSVSVMPKPTEIDVVINKSDLKLDVFRASGAGGQHVNKTESAVRLTHIPTGMAVECQVHRSQIKNKELALEILRTRLYEKELEAQQSKFQSQRKIQIGSGTRSEKIRTYNFKEDRISDHRLGENRFDLEEFLSGGDGLEELLGDLLEASRTEKLLEVLEEFQQTSKS